MSKYIIDILSPKQIKSVAKFLHLQGAAQLDETEWLNKMLLFWDLNPHFNSKVHSRGWVIIDEQGGVQGFLGNVPVKYCNNGQEEFGFWATSWYVAPHARTMSINLYRKFLEQGGVLYNTTPTPAVAKIIEKKFQFKELKQLWLKSEFIMPLSAQGTIKLFQRKTHNTGILSFVLSAAGFFTYLISLSLYLLSKTISFDRVLLVEQKKIPKEYDDWWAKRKTKSKYFLCKDRKTLEWLFFSNGLAEKRKFISIYKNNKYIGIALLKLVISSEYKSVELVNIEVMGETRNIRLQIFHKLRSVIRKWSSDAAFFRAYAMVPSDNKALPTIGFFKTSGRSRFFYLDRRGSIESTVCDFSPLDGDRILFP